MLELIYKFIMHFFKILPKTPNLHISITVGQQYNVFEQFDVMKL